MATATTTRILEHSTVDQVWERVGDFANPDWLRGVTRLRLEGEGPGAVRVLGVPGGVQLTETLVEEGDHSLTWTLNEGSPMPVTGYRATLTVGQTPEGHTQVTWTSTFESAGPPDSVVVPMLESMQADMLAGL